MSMEKNVSRIRAISEREYKSQKAWGLLAVINLYECDPGLIKDPRAIKRFTMRLCREIKMKRYGEPLIALFAEGRMEGYSMMQFIETSSITAHFDSKISRRAFIDIFSCKYFHADKAAAFCQKFFKSKEYKISVFLRY